MSTSRPHNHLLAFHDSTQHGQVLVTVPNLSVGHDSTMLRLGPEGTSLAVSCSGHEVLVANRGSHDVTLNGECLAPGSERRSSLPYQVWGDGFSLAGFHGARPESRADSLATLATLGQSTQAMANINRSPAPETLTGWFETLGEIQRHAACSLEFYNAAVRAMVGPGGLDAGMLIMRRNGRWGIEASSVATPPLGIEFEPYYLELAARQSETIYHAARQTDDDAEQVGVFASPVFDEDRKVIGVLYGSRRPTDANRRRGIRDLEALWLQLVSDAVSAGIARRKYEADASRRQVLLEQAFPVEVARQLSSQADFALVAEERDVTILFADLVSSSTLCENLGLEQSYQFLADVMDALTRGVQKHDGAIVDYYGDGLVAMWNAPVDQPQHAQLACRAGIDLLSELPEINAAWQSRLGRKVEFGVGIHTGIASVGNSGSRQRIKYGPRGICVNIASRIEKATRKLNAPMIVSQATWDRLEGRLTGYRLGKFRLAGIEETLQLFAVVGFQQEFERHNAYSDLLSMLEAGDFSQVVERLDNCSDESLDEMSLRFLQQQIGVLGDQVLQQEDVSHSPSELVFDLTDSSDRSKR